MATMTPKECYLRLGRNEEPAYVPIFTMMGNAVEGECPVKMFGPMGLWKANNFVDGGYDMWGVKYVADANTGATLPDNSSFLLEDIADWEKVIKFPERVDYEHMDWQKMYDDGVKFDRNLSAAMMGPGLMPFQQLVALMGFTNGLMALYEDPESVSDMLNAMVDWIMPVVESYIDVYKPDLWYILDDTCAKQVPFFSPEIYHDLFKPIYARLAKPANERGIPIQYHNCGFVEPFLEDAIDWGVKYWDPAQETNDLLRVKEQYKGKIVICGGWDWDTHIPQNWPEWTDDTEAELREGVRKAIEKYAPGYGYSICGGIPGRDENTMKANKAVITEMHYAGHAAYGNK